MSVLNLNSSKERAFLRGFAKGFAAPLMLNGRFRDPVQIPEVPAVKVPPAANDWSVVGADIQKALDRYEAQPGRPQPR